MHSHWRQAAVNVTLWDCRGGSWCALVLNWVMCGTKGALRQRGLEGFGGVCTWGKGDAKAYPPLLTGAILNEACDLLCFFTVAAVTLLGEPTILGTYADSRNYY